MGASDTPIRLPNLARFEEIGSAQHPIDAPKPSALLAPIEAVAPLACQFVLFLSRKPTIDFVDIQRQFMRIRPHSQTLEVVHPKSFTQVSRFSPHLCYQPVACSQKPAAQKLLTKFFPGSCRIFPASSSSNRAAKISEDDNSASNLSTISSMWVVSSALSMAKILPS
jgi:hypothetical protein